MESKIQYKSTYLQDKNRLTDIKSGCLDEGVEEEKNGSLKLVETNIYRMDKQQCVAQYPVTKHNGKECEKEYTCVCLCIKTKPLCWTEEINTTL